MTTATTHISAEALPDLQVLLDTLVGIAESRLLSSGAFSPFAAHLAEQEGIAVLIPDPVHGNLTARAIAGLLEHQVRRATSSSPIRAAAVCEHVELRKAERCVPAVKVSVEHAFGESVSFFLPYEATASRDVVFGRMLARPRPRSMFISED